MGERSGRKSLRWWRRRKHISVILKATKKYAGNIVLRKLESVTPEVGIDIVEKYQRQGIAYDTLQLFMRKIKSICKIDMPEIFSSLLRPDMQGALFHFSGVS